MARLIDDLRAAKSFCMPHFVAPRHHGRWTEYTARTLELFRNPELPVLLIDNVASYYFAGTDQEYWNLEKDFPNIAPPYPQFWLEHKLPRQIVSKTEGVTDLTRITPNGRVGMLFTVVAPENVSLYSGELPAGTRWLLWCDLWIDYGLGAGITGPHGATFLCVDADGRLIDLPCMQSFASEELAPIMKAYMTWFYPGLLAISFLHCKNVTLVDHQVDAPLAKKWRGRHGFNPTGYHTLVIEPLKEILRTAGRAQEHGLAKAMHICRGHFADYRNGRGLFGKYKQVVWIPSMVRGTKGKAAPREMEVRV
jgi:hypothetical protein